MVAASSSNGTSLAKMDCDSEQSNVSNATSKLSKIGRRLRDSCRNLRGKHPSGGASSNPEDYASISAPNESTRSKHYVPMDFSGKTGRIIRHKDVPGHITKDGYTYYRRKIVPTNVDHLLTETQANIHKEQPWYHKGIGRDIAQRILVSHSVDGLFLVRESSVQGGYVISYYCGGRAYHAPVLPSTSPDDRVTFSLDDGKTKFFDLLQMVEFYQLNKATLHHKLTHYAVSNSATNLRSESPTSRSDSSSCRGASDGSLDSQNSTETIEVVSKVKASATVSAASASSSGFVDVDVDEAASMTSSTSSSKMDNNHNKNKEVDCLVKAETKSISADESDEASDGENSVATAVDAAMASAEEDQENDHVEEGEQEDCLKMK